ncbi:hypothetical protein DVS77_07155 [Mycolicibacterium moriokaense]|nr:hypothetical protein DVS77_07155 [Mycolicibacterium moriokaense]
MTSSFDGDPSDDVRQYAFHMEPQVHADGDTWTAFYPGADWSVSGASDREALDRLGEEFKRRQSVGVDPLSHADDIYRRHLREPVPGVYAVDNDLYRELVHAPAAERKLAVEEAERRRRSGQRYTLSDYLRDRRDET